MIRLRLLAALTAIFTCLLLPGLAAAAERTSTTPTGERTPLHLSEDTSSAASSTPGGGGSIVRTIVGLAIVLAVIYGVSWVLKQAKASREESLTGEGLQTVASLGLGPNRSLHLVRAGDDLMLIGVAEHAVTPVRTYTEAEAVAAGLLPVGGHREAARSAVAPEERPAKPFWGTALAGKLRGTASTRTPSARQPLTIGQLVGSIREKTVRS